MAEAKDAVEFYWDPVCPWCWITARWMEDVGRQKDIKVHWKLFSLRKINEGRELPPQFGPRHLMGLRALRVAAAVRQDLGEEAVGQLYTAMGARWHHDEVDIGQVSELASILETLGFSTDFAAAADDEAWDEVIKKDMENAVAKAGSDVGVPLIVFDGGSGPGFFRSGVQPGADRQGRRGPVGCHGAGGPHGGVLRIQTHSRDRTDLC
jgi:predicted DsbA family dithiol-disulfide isomerase